jgi:hypothetical protein
MGSSRLSLKAPERGTSVATGETWHEERKSTCSRWMRHWSLEVRKCQWKHAEHMQPCLEVGAQSFMPSDSLMLRCAIQCSSHHYRVAELRYAGGRSSRPAADDASCPARNTRRKAFLGSSGVRRPSCPQSWSPLRCRPAVMHVRQIHLAPHVCHTQPPSADRQSPSGPSAKGSMSSDQMG